MAHVRDTHGLRTREDIAERRVVRGYEKNGPLAAKSPGVLGVLCMYPVTYGGQSTVERASVFFGKVEEGPANHAENRLMQDRTMYLH